MTKSVFFSTFFFLSTGLNAQFEIEINPEAPVKSSKSIEINASKEQVWSVLTSIDKWPSWQTDIKQTASFCSLHCSFLLSAILLIKKSKHHHFLGK